MKSIVNLYFDYWNNHNIDDLRRLFDDSVILEDWENSFVGIEEVLQENNNIFKNFPKVRALITDLGFSENNAFAKIKVFLEEDNVIDVIDTFEFKNDKIIKIKAYKG
jgi:hypothetical protein